MKTKRAFIGAITVVLVVPFFILFMGFKKSVNDDSLTDDSPLYKQSLQSSVQDMERKGMPLNSVLTYSISGNIDSLNSGTGLKGIVVILTKVETASKNGLYYVTTGYTCGYTCSSTCASTCGYTVCGYTCASTCASTCGYTVCGATCGSTCSGSTYCGSTCPTINANTCTGSTYCGSTCPTINANTCTGSTYCGSACPTINASTCTGSTYCGSTCPTINANTCTGSTYCGTQCPTVNGNTCSGSTYCGATCPTVNQVTCYNTCNIIKCDTTTFIYDTTDVNGNFSFSGLNNGNYIVTPQSSSYTFYPVNRSTTIADQNITNLNFTTSPVSVEELEPKHFDFVNIFPNPFSNSTVITYELYEMTNVFINIYDNSGKVVMKFSYQRQIAGSYYTTWEPSNCRSGIYYVEFTFGKTKLTKKVMYQK